MLLIVSGRLYVVNFAVEGVKIVWRVSDLARAFDTNVYACVAGQKAKKAIVAGGLGKGRRSAAREITCSKE